MDNSLPIQDNDVVAASKVIWKRLIAVLLGMGLLLGLVALSVTFKVPFADSIRRYWDQRRISHAYEQTDAFRAAVSASLAAHEQKSDFGRWSYSNGHEGHIIEIGPDAFYYKRTDCSGLAEYAYGRVQSISDEQITLDVRDHIVARPASLVSQRRRPLFAFEAVLYKVRWGEARLLVPAAQMLGFCMLATDKGADAIENSDYPHKTMPGASEYFQRFAFDGLPQVPKAYEQYLPR